MARYNIDDIFAQLEKEAADELLQLERVGAEYYSTANLIRLRGQWEARLQLFKLLQRLLLGIAAFSPVWIGIYFLLAWLKLRLLALLAIALFPASILTLVAGLFFMYHYFHGRGHLENVGDQIEKELRQRAQEPMN